MQVQYSNTRVTVTLGYRPARTGGHAGRQACDATGLLSDMDISFGLVAVSFISARAFEERHVKGMYGSCDERGKKIRHVKRQACFHIHPPKEFNLCLVSRQRQEAYRAMTCKYTGVPFNRLCGGGRKSATTEKGMWHLSGSYDCLQACHGTCY